MELLKIWAAVLRRKWLLIQAVIFFTVIGIASAMMLPKSYVATTKVMVSSSDTSSAILSDLGLQELAVGLSGESDDIQNHIALAMTRPILSEVIWRLQLRDEDGGLLPPDKLIVAGTFDSLKASPQIGIIQHQSTDIILITATTDHPEKSRMVADTLARVYMTETQERSRTETKEARAFVESRLVVVEEDFDQALKEMADVQQQEQVIDLDSEVRSAVSRLSEMMLLGEETTTRAIEIRAQLSELRGFQGQESLDFVGPGTVNENSDIRALREQLTSLRTQRITALLDKTEAHPDVERIDTQIIAAEDELVSALEEQHGLDPRVIGLQVELAGLADRSRAIDDAIDRTTDRFSAYPEKMRRLGRSELAASAAEEVYKALQSQSYQIAVAEAMSASPIQLVEPAQRPDKHLSPRLLVNTLIGLALGLLAGLGFVALFEYIDDSIKGGDELKDTWDAPQLGIIPQFKAGLGVTIASSKPTAPVYEAFRTLRSSITYATLDKPARTVMITSSLPGEGKSTVLASLGVAIAAEGKSVCVVDCDLRRPTQHTFHQSTNNAKGVTQVLIGQVPLEEALQATPVEGLYVLSSGPLPPNPGKLVESLKLRQLIVELAKRFDVVLVDAPPALVVNDALLIAQMVDHSLMVVENASTTRRVLLDARERLEAHGVEPLGLILNKLDYSAAGYGAYKKAYTTYYRDSGAAS